MAELKRNLALVFLHFGFTQARGQLVEHAVDELVAVGRTVDFRQLDTFVDHHAVRHVDALEQLPGGQAQNGQFNRVELFKGQVQARRQGSVDLGLGWPVRRAGCRGSTLVGKSVKSLSTRNCASISFSEVPAMWHWYSAWVAS